MGYPGIRHAAFIAASVGTRCGLRYAEIDTERGAKISAQMARMGKEASQSCAACRVSSGRVVVASGAVPVPVAARVASS